MALSDSWDVGDLTRVGNHTGGTRGAFTTAANVVADPTAVTLRTGKPDGTTVTYSWPSGTPALTREELGRFYADIPRDQAGIWSFVLTGTGAVATVDQWQDFVREAVA